MVIAEAKEHLENQAIRLDKIKAQFDGKINIFTT